MELEFIYKRHSVRQFKDEAIPEDVIRKIIGAATYAPSGKNQQNWHFVVVTDKSRISEIARLVEAKNAQLCSYLRDEAKIKAVKRMVGYHTAFKGAPVLVLLYAGHYKTIADMLLEDAVLPANDILEYARPNPAIQNVAAAMENLQLAAADLGYGACWMTGPTYAAREISQYIGFQKEGYDLVAMSPLGIPLAGNIASPPRKPLTEVLTFIRSAEF